MSSIFYNKIYPENPSDTVAEIYIIGLDKVIPGEYRLACV